MTKLKIILIVSLLLNAVIVSGASYIVYKKGGISFIESQLKTLSATQDYPNYYLQKKNIFESTNTIKPDKVFIGDSITDHGEFQEYFAGELVLNRGISNDNSKGVLNRITEVVERNPNEVYLMIGINDILYSTDLLTYENNVRNIIQYFESTDVKLYIQSVLPVNNELYGDVISNESVEEFNVVLENIAREYQIDFINLNELFQDNEGQLDEKYTIDGIHLTGEGYNLWMDSIKK